MKKVSFAVLLAALAVSGALLGCDTKEEVRSVQWYKASENKAIFEESGISENSEFSGKREGA